MNLPLEYQALLILCELQATGGATTYQALKIGRKCQRRDRVKRILEYFREKGWLQLVDGEYRLTEEGRLACPWKRDFLEFCWELRCFMKEEEEPEEDEYG
ncbi:MAG: hypothetical protein QXR87_04670 [Candidatus Hadarchaeales archaeon]